MASTSRQSIVGGFPNPIFVNETGVRDAILPGVFISETVSLSQFIHWKFRPTTDDEQEIWFPPRRPAVTAGTAPDEALTYWKFRPTVDDDQEIWTPPRRPAIGNVVPPNAALPWRRFLPTTDDDQEIWTPPRRPAVGTVAAGPPGLPTPPRRMVQFWSEVEEEPLWLPQEYRRRSLGFVRRRRPQVSIIIGWRKDSF